jgi:hypothetical protein
MIKIVGDKVFFEHEPEANCELCGEPAELRPYGPNGENICITCGFKDPVSVQERMHEALDNKLAEAGVSLHDVILVDPEAN